MQTTHFSGLFVLVEKILSHQILTHTHAHTQMLLKLDKINNICTINTYVYYCGIKFKWLEVFFLKPSKRHHKDVQHLQYQPPQMGETDSW